MSSTTKKTKRKGQREKEKNKQKNKKWRGKGGSNDRELVEEEEKSVGLKKKVVEEKGIDGRKNDVRGENNQEKEKQIMVNKKELNDQEKEKEVEKEN